MNIWVHPKEGALSAAFQAHAYGQAKAILCGCKWLGACQVAGSRFAFDR